MRYEHLKKCAEVHDLTNLIVAHTSECDMLRTLEVIFFSNLP